MIIKYCCLREVRDALVAKEAWLSTACHYREAANTFSRRNSRRPRRYYRNHVVGVAKTRPPSKSIGFDNFSRPSCKSCCSRLDDSFR